MNDSSSKSAVRPKVVVERTYRARVEELWELWTTKKGFESWWGPEGFRVGVHTLEARVGGALHYDMIADAPEQIEAMKQMARPSSHETRGRFAEFKPHERLDHPRDRLSAGREALRKYDGGGVLPVGREHADGDHAGSDARGRVHEDVDGGHDEPAHEAGQAVRRTEDLMFVGERSRAALLARWDVEVCYAR